MPVDKTPMITAEMAGKMIEFAASQAPDKLASTIITILINSLRTRDNMLRGMLALSNEVKELKALISGSVSQEGEEVSGLESEVPLSSGADASGAPLTPEQAVVEAQMDAAIGAEIPTKTQAKRPALAPVPQGLQQKQPPRPPQVTRPQVSPEQDQAEKEALMDAAVAAAKGEKR